MNISGKEKAIQIGWKWLLVFGMMLTHASAIGMTDGSIVTKTNKKRYLWRPQTIG